MICIHQKPKEDCIHCLREKVLELTDRLDQMTNLGVLIAMIITSAALEEWFHV